MYRTIKMMNACECMVASPLLMQNTHDPCYLVFISLYRLFGKIETLVTIMAVGHVSL